MVSTYLDYNLIARDMKLSLRRVSEQTIVARDTQYYRENIGSVASVDEFLADYRLYSYAMKAYGLADMIESVAFMRKVLESDLSDDNSFANKLTDERYRDFTMAFSFSGGTAVSQTEAQLDEMIGLYNTSIASIGETQKEETRYYNVMIDKVTSVDQLLNNDRLRTYVFTVFGIDESTYSRETLRKVLSSNADDPDSYENTVLEPRLSELEAARADAQAKLQQSGTTQAEKLELQAKIATYNKSISTVSNYLAMAAAFQFEADGTVAAGSAQTAAHKKTMNELYVSSNSRVTPQAALLNKADFEEKIASITTVSELVADTRLYNYIRTAFDLNEVTIVPATIKNILTSDPDDPNSYINTIGKGNENYKALARAFNFQADGTLAAGDAAQTAEQTTLTSSRYMTRYNDKDDAADEKAIGAYKLAVEKMTSVSDFIETASIYDFALQAVGLDPDSESARTIKRVLTSDLTDPESFVYTLKDERYLKLAQLFNFTTSGDIGVPALAQSETLIQETAKTYIVNKSRFGSEEDKTKAEAEAEYYTAEVAKLSSLDEFLADSRLVDFALEANGIDPENVTLDFLRDIFTSDLDDPKSFINQQQNSGAYIALVTSFNFDSGGNVLREDKSVIITRQGLYETLDRYLHQSLEEQAGEDNAGVRLALYFERQAGSLVDAYDLLADDALAEVFRTIFSLPDEFSSMDIDQQAKIVEKNLDLEKLSDPAELKKLLARFTVLYDLENNMEVDPAVVVLSGSGSNIGISADTLFQLSQLRKGG
ncbi:DUF1217 domain-containing protein [Sinorhizobium meliloti]|uniref:DUF1217 domain-containing protein n=2 Tax=Rhizobium meliloti TaxID=382 RepID=UPI0003639EED|nr:DUF1217 domain-containing protein [Sinorhizobium meliloti]AIL98692.1 flagellar protein [Sinorhizobium meliloti]ASP57468.1 DUF1217 domain-containing protein [Sinorhizobium meliloti]ATA98221.1 flagellar protein [Sinorhizobium meliloti]ATB03971.1 flagellar protein [Sinorhizobium meliloti]MDE3770272.1 DUF1217 domain-containing protein [Sinorhizobium meliloti]